MSFFVLHAEKGHETRMSIYGTFAELAADFGENPDDDAVEIARDLDTIRLVLFWMLVIVPGIAPVVAVFMMNHR
jgi:hypothetical protein